MDLIQAVQGRDKVAVAAHLKAGNDANVPDSHGMTAKAIVDKVSKTGLTALGYAHEKGHTEVAKLLKNAGASS